MASKAAKTSEEEKEKKMCKAFAGMKPGPVLENYEFEARPLGKDELAVDITASGMCHSDVHKLCDEWSEVGAGHSNYPLVPGHEVVGIVTAVGDDVKDFKVGDRVGFGPQRDSCRKCDKCKAGEQQLCHTFVSLYDGKDKHTGGYASHIRAPEVLAFHIPDEIADEHAAPLLCAGVTTYSGIVHYAKNYENPKVAVVGVGGLGHLALPYSIAMGYETTAITRSADKKESLEKMGAKVLISTNAENMKKAASSFDLIVVTASANLDWKLYLDLLRVDGTLCLLGLPSEKLQIPAFALVASRKKIGGSLIGGANYMKEMLAFSAKHNIRPLIEKVPVTWNDAPKATKCIQRIIDNDVRYRFVMIFPKTEATAAAAAKAKAAL